MKHGLSSVSGTPQHSIIHWFCAPASMICGFDRDEDISRSPTNFKHTLLISKVFYPLTLQALIIISSSYIYTETSPASRMRPLRAARQSLTAMTQISTQDPGLQLHRNASTKPNKMTERDLLSLRYGVCSIRVTTCKAAGATRLRVWRATLRTKQTRLLRPP